MNADLIIFNAGQLLTCASSGKPKRGAEMLDAGTISGGAVAVIGDKIAAIGKSDDILHNFAAKNVIDAKGKVVCPGFVDPHTHIVYAGDRLNEFEMKIRGTDYLEILENGGGIISTVKETRAASLEDLVNESRRRLDKMLVSGTTACEIKTGYGLDMETELKMLDCIEELDRVHTVDIVPTFLAAHAVPPEFTANPDGYVDLICDKMLPRAWEWFTRSRFYGRVPVFADVFCEKGAFDLEQSRRMLKTAQGFGFRLKAHVDEFTNLGGSGLVIGMDADSIDHLDQISDDEIEMLSRSNTIGVVTPTVNFNFGSTHFADARKLIDSGCAVAISTDYNPGSAPCPSQPMAMAIACRYQKLLPAEALNAAAINAAFAIGMSERIGSIEAGKQADILIFDSKDFREIAYQFGRCTIRTVVKNGKIACL